MLPYTASYWYRASDDPDRSRRDGWQQGNAVDSPDAAYQVADRLRAQGYEVQRIVLETTCLTCLGAGKLSKPPKGTRKTKIADLPDWRLTWSICQTCRGAGATGAIDLPLERIATHG